MPKSFLQSKTIWFNIAGVIGTVLVNASQALPPLYAPLALGLGNLVLRFFTKEGISVF